MLSLAVIRNIPNMLETTLVITDGEIEKYTWHLFCFIYFPTCVM